MIGFCSKATEGAWLAMALTVGGQWKVGRHSLPECGVRASFRPRTVATRVSLPIRRLQLS